MLIPCMHEKITLHLRKCIFCFRKSVAKLKGGQCIFRPSILNLLNKLIVRRSQKKKEYSDRRRQSSVVFTECYHRLGWFTSSQGILKGFYISFSGGPAAVLLSGLCKFLFPFDNILWRWQLAWSFLYPEVGKVTLTSNGYEALSDEFLLKSNGDEALNDIFL